LILAPLEQVKLAAKNSAQDSEYSVIISEEIFQAASLGNDL